MDTQCSVILIYFYQMSKPFAEIYHLQIPVVKNERHVCLICTRIIHSSIKVTSFQNVFPWRTNLIISLALQAACTVTWGSQWAGVAVMS